MKIDKQLDKIFEETNQAFEEDRFKDVDEMLKAVDIENESIEILLGWITTCLCATDKLDYIEKFYDKVEEKFKRDEPGRAAALLKGLDPRNRKWKTNYYGGYGWGWD